MPARPWYERFEEFFNSVEEKRSRYMKRCKELGVEPSKLHEDLWRDLIARIVHESNWQEDLCLPMDQTRELTNLAFDEQASIAGPHLDINQICKDHRDNVVELRREKKSDEQIAAFNLSVAHLAVMWLSDAMRLRVVGKFFLALNALRAMWDAGAAGASEAAAKLADDAGLTPDQKLQLIAISALVHVAPPPTDVSTTLFATLDEVYSDNAPFFLPLTGDDKTTGELLRTLSNLKPAELATPMTIEYLNFLHRLTTMGLSPIKKCGHFRTGPVHVGNQDLVFPVASVVPKMMEEYCQNFQVPLVCPTTPEIANKLSQILCTPADLILLAAQQSHRFVRIHPYSDGNGRVSRLLMNLVLRFVYPPVYLKADKKGRHRYSQALRRGDNGNYKPLACLIVMALDGIYDKLLDSVT